MGVFFNTCSDFDMEKAVRVLVAQWLPNTLTDSLMKDLAIQGFIQAILMLLDGTKNSIF